MNVVEMLFAQQTAQPFEQHHKNVPHFTMLANENLIVHKPDVGQKVCCRKFQIKIAKDTHAGNMTFANGLVINIKIACKW